MFYKRSYSEKIRNIRCWIWSSVILCLSFFLIKLQAFRPTEHRRFPVNIAKFLRTPNCKNIIGRSRAAATSKLECFVIKVNGWAVNYYHKALHLGCFNSPRSASEHLRKFSPNLEIALYFPSVMKLKIDTRYTAQNMKFSMYDFFSKCDQICLKLQIWSHLPKKFLIENFALISFVNNEFFIIGESFSTCLALLGAWFVSVYKIKFFILNSIRNKRK